MAGGACVNSEASQRGQIAIVVVTDNHWNPGHPGSQFINALHVGRSPNGHFQTPRREATARGRSHYAHEWNVKWQSVAGIVIEAMETSSRGISWLIVRATSFYFLKYVLTVPGQQDWKVGLGKERVTNINNTLSLLCKRFSPLRGEKQTQKVCKRKGWAWKLATSGPLRGTWVVGMSDLGCHFPTDSLLPLLPYCTEPWLCWGLAIGPL